MPKPILSIGIIFKNEIRCLERCLQALAPLRETFPCELVMADTGSDDGSREVAEKYADILFDFPWINDFAAARNAVMDRCSGRWYLSLDADEWFDEDVKQLVGVIRANDRKYNAYMVRIRNYTVKTDPSEYSDFFCVRMLRMSTGFRYQGAIHERWEGTEKENLNISRLDRTILHHDGYMGLNDKEGEAKRLRNKAILKEELDKDPEDVRRLLQYMESSRPDPDYLDYLRRGVASVEARNYGWEFYGPVIYRYAVLDAKDHSLPELEEWIARAEELFPDSFYNRIDINFAAFFSRHEKKEYESGIPYGERYLAAMEDYEAGRGDQAALMVSTLIFASAKWKQFMQLALSNAYRECRQPEKSVEILEQIERLDDTVVKEMLESLQKMQVITDQDTAPSMLRLYDRIEREPDETRAKGLMTTFLQTAPIAFGPDVREKEAAREDFHRYSYTLFVPLAGKCEVGNAAAVMETKSVQEIDRLLGLVKSWGDFSVSALIYALEQGATFPPEGRTLRSEEMGRIVKRLSQYQGRFFSMVSQTAPRQYGGSWQQLTWARSLVLAAVQGFDWSDEKLGLALAEAFAKVEGEFVSRCYTAEVLCDENIYVLLPMHRFGWYCGRAFAALEAGDAPGYVRLLREGLEACPKMKAMVEFLTKHTPQLKPPVPGELLALAEKVRMMLSVYAPDDPAVVMLKQSAAYQKVAHLIEGPSVGLAGQLKQ